MKVTDFNTLRRGVSLCWIRKSHNFKEGECIDCHEREMNTSLKTPPQKRSFWEKEKPSRW